MSDDSSNQQPQPPSTTRRSSFAGQTFADLFGGGRSREQRGSFGDDGNNQAQQGPGPITTAAAQAQRRRLSLTTLGLSSSPDRFNAFRTSRDSVGSANSASIDESAIEDDTPSNQSSMPSTPFQRRMSFGARALRDVRNGSGGTSSNGGSAGQNGTRPPPAVSHARAPSGTISSRDAKGREGFNWSENFRSRAERSSSIAQQGGLSASPNEHPRAQSIAAMEPPIRPTPKEVQRPDHIQERILRGDFYMD